MLCWAESLEPLNTLDLKLLTYKLVCLLALATAHRVQTLSLIKISKILISEDKIIIDIVDQIKTSRVGAPQPSFILPFFNDRKSACVASVLLQYLDRTKELRQEEDYLFLTLKKPYHKASSQSISRWLKNCLTEAGVDRKYTAHSTHEVWIYHVNIIKDTAGWSKDSQIFAKFYNRQIKLDKQLFVKSFFLKNSMH